MPDSINSVDTVQMSMVLYALKKAQKLEEAGNTLIDKTLKKMQENDDELGKESLPWLGQNIDGFG
jgi:hypothetical protein